MATDLDYPVGPGDYKSGFLGVDYRNDPAGAYSGWIEPGDKFFRVFSASNADGSPATAQEVADAVNQWENVFTRAQRWRVRLHHLAELKWVHENQPKIWVYYTCTIPASKVDELKALLIPDVLEWLGGTFAAAKATLEARSAGLSEKFWRSTHPDIPAGQPDVAIQGREGDFF